MSLGSSPGAMYAKLSPSYPSRRSKEVKQTREWTTAHAPKNTDGDDSLFKRKHERETYRPRSSEIDLDDLLLIENGFDFSL